MYVSNPMKPLTLNRLGSERKKEERKNKKQRALIKKLQENNDISSILKEFGKINKKPLQKINELK